MQGKISFIIILQYDSEYRANQNCVQFVIFDAKTVRPIICGKRSERGVSHVTMSYYLACTFTFRWPIYDTIVLIDVDYVR
jgi:hypothetical protein